MKRWASGDEPPDSIPLQVRSSSPSFMGSIIVTETECNRSCKFGPFHLNSAKTKKLGHSDGSLNKGKQPHTKKKKTFQIHLVLMTGVSSLGALRDPLYSCSAGTQMQPHQRGFVSLWPLTGHILMLSWLGICSITLSRRFTHSKETHCAPNCMQGSRQQGRGILQDGRQQQKG